MTQSIGNSINNDENLNEFNRKIILNEIREFFHIYLFKGYIVNASNFEISNLFNLENDDLNILKTVHFLLSDEVLELIEILPLLMRNLSHSTRKEIEESRGAIKGIIDWNQTIKTRISKGGSDDTLFVCQPPSKYYDLEENQLLKFLLREIVYLNHKFLDFNNLKTDLNIEKLDNNLDWQQIIDFNMYNIKKILKKVYFDKITTIKKVSLKHLRKTYKNRNQLYHKLVKAYVLYEDLFILNKKEILKELLEKRLITTLDDNKLYELYVLFNLIKIFPESKIVKLLYSNNEYVLKAEVGYVKITMYYQKTPEKLKQESQYLNLLENYTINKKVKSPDIIIEFECNGTIFYRLIEIKNSSDADYIRESVYKVLGYYNDFKGKENTNFVENYPVVLVMWGGITLNKNYDPFNDEIIILNRLEFLKYLKKLIQFRGLNFFDINST